MSRMDSPMLVSDRAMSHQRIVAARCSASSTSSSSVACNSAAAVPCIHRLFEDPPSSSVRMHTRPAFPDSTAAAAATVLARSSVRDRGPSTGISAGFLSAVHHSWSNAASVASASAPVAFCADGVDSSSSDSELQYSKDNCVQNSPADECTKKRMH